MLWMAYRNLTTKEDHVTVEPIIEDMVFSGDVAVGATWTYGNPGDDTCEVLHVFSKDEGEMFFATQVALGNDELGGEGQYREWEAWHAFWTCLRIAFKAGMT